MRNRDIRSFGGLGEPISAAWRPLRRGQLEAAIVVYQRLLAIEPGPQLRNRTGDLLVAARQGRAAIPLFLEAAEEYRVRGFFAKARAIHGKILRLEPNHRAASRRLAQLEIEGRATRPCGVRR